YPTNVTADAAFDAWYVYQRAALHGGIGAVALNQHAHRVYQRAADGTPTVPKDCPCRPISSSITPMAIAPNASAARSSFLKRRGKAVTMPNLLKARAVSRMSIGKWADRCV